MSDSPGTVTGTKPGERLRAERERRGMSTQQIAEQLHVDGWVVEALEAGRHESLGAPVYAKGHLRQYAMILDLDAEEIVSACAEQTDPPLVVMRTQMRLRAPLSAAAGSLLVAAAGIAVIAMTVWGYRVWRESAVAPQPVAQSEDADRDVNAGAAASPGEVTQVPAQTVATPTLAGNGGAANVALTQSTVPAAVPQLRGASAGQPVRIRLSFSADSWVELYDANQQRVFFDLAPANSVRSFSVAAPARLFLGFAPGVQLELDGRPVTISDEVIRANVAHFTVDARGRLAPAGTLAR